MCATRNTKLCRGAIGLACALSFLLCCAWGATGHKVVAQIAYDHLTVKARAEVDKLLGGSTLAEFSVWADQIKSDPAWKWTKPWHYADMPQGATEFEMDRDCPADGCVVKGIQRYGAVLKSNGASHEEKVQALKFLTHYVGDIHQPLHVGRKGDSGGNAIEVMLFSRKGNLHWVWDDGLIKQRGMEYGAYASKLEAGLKAEDRKSILASADPVVWASESNKLALRYAYDGATAKLGEPALLGQDYCDRALPVVDEQLTKAGLRLARLLNEIFDPTGSMPDAPTAVAPSAAPPDKPAEQSAPALKADTKFVGSKNSEVYHLPGCSVVHQIKPGNLVEYKEAPAGKRLHQGCPR